MSSGRQRQQQLFVVFPSGELLPVSPQRGSEPVRIGALHPPQATFIPLTHLTSDREGSSCSTIIEGRVSEAPLCATSFPAVVCPAPVPPDADHSAPGPEGGDAKRNNHKAVEKRRRDKINTWISELAALIPPDYGDLINPSTSKGSILRQATSYIKELKAENEQLRQQDGGAAAGASGAEKELEVLREENQLLAALCKSAGLRPPVRRKRRRSDLDNDDSS